MIYYFTGTGNSGYIAERLAELTKDNTASINDEIKSGNYTGCGGKTVIVTPTYGWRIPRIVYDWVLKSGFKENGKVWFVMTCGSETGNAARYNRKLAGLKNLCYMGTAEIVMPENYIAMFDAPEWDEAEKIIKAAEPYILKAAGKIQDDEEFEDIKPSLPDIIKSNFINPFFYKLCVHSEKFYAGSACIHCGKCAAVCPLNNIKLENGLPRWESSCTHCMACICYCPVKAIEYGKKSQGKPRYSCRYYKK